MAYLENIATVGLGYLVYKRIMSELALEADKPVKAGQLLGWDTPAQFEQGLRLWAGVPDDCTVKGGFSVVCPPSETYQDWLTAGGDPTKVVKQDVPVPLADISFGIGGYTFLPEGFELVGPSRVGITRPKGLD